MCTATHVRYGCGHTRLSHWRSCRAVDARPSLLCSRLGEEWVVRAQKCGECVFRRWKGGGGEGERGGSGEVGGGWGGDGDMMGWGWGGVLGWRAGVGEEWMEEGLVGTLGMGG